jgi:hypothetical protein
MRVYSKSSYLQLEVLTGQISRVASFDLDLTHANIRSPQSETLHARELGSGSLPAAIELPPGPPGIRWLVYCRGQWETFGCPRAVSLHGAAPFWQWQWHKFLGWDTEPLRMGSAWP